MAIPEKRLMVGIEEVCIVTLFASSHCS